MQIIIPDGLGDTLLTGGLAVWVLDKAHAAWARQRSSRKERTREEITADLVTEAMCGQHRASCRGSVDSELAQGNRAFDWLEAAIRVLVRKSGITPQEIEDEMGMLRRARGANHGS